MFDARYFVNLALVDVLLKFRLYHIVFLLKKVFLSTSLAMLNLNDCLSRNKKWFRCSVLKLLGCDPKQMAAFVLLSLTVSTVSFTVWSLGCFQKKKTPQAVLSIYLTAVLVVNVCSAY